MNGTFILHMHCDETKEVEDNMGLLIGTAVLYMYCNKSRQSKFVHKTRNLHHGFYAQMCCIFKQLLQKIHMAKVLLYIAKL